MARKLRCRRGVPFRVKRRLDLCLPTSSGGHLELLSALGGIYANVPHLFVTPPSRQAEELRRLGHRVEEIVNPERNPVLLARNVARALRVVTRERPRIVLTTGTGVTVPLCLAAKGLGAQLIFIETMARVDSGSRTARILYRFCDHFLVQWPELAVAFPRAEVCRPLLLDDVGGRANPDGRGTFVAVGNHYQPFDRLLRAVDAAADRGLLPLPILVQAGTSSYRARNFKTIESLTPEQVQRAMRDHRLVICHGGGGLVSIAVRNGRRALVLPRRRAHSEHVDDHQVAMTARMARLGLVVSLDEVPMESAIELAKEPPILRGTLPGARLSDRVRELIEAAL